MLYSLRNLKKKYNGRTVLDLPELFIEAKKIYGLLGPNGSGKSTLLNILSFLSSPSTGAVFFDGQAVNFSEKILQKFRRQVVLVDQHPVMFSTSVYKNVEFGLKIRNISLKKRKHIVEASLDRVGMREFMHTHGTGLSGGETQRVAIARALACSPKVLLFDEPTASVDVSNQIVIENIIRDLHADQNISIIIATHNLLQASKLTHENIYLFEGRAGTFIYENIFTGQGIIKQKKPYCLINKKNSIPLKAPENGLIKISINPKSLKILKNTPLSNEPDALNGKIFQLSQEKDWVRVLVDAGIVLSVLMRRKEYEQIRPCIGDAVQVICPDYGVEVIFSGEQINS